MFLRKKKMMTAIAKMKITSIKVKFFSMAFLIYHAVRSALFLDPGIQQLVLYFSVFDHTAAESTFKDVSSLFQNAAGISVGGVWFRINAKQAELIEGIVGELGDRLGHNASAPVGFAYPVTELRCEAMHVVMDGDPDATDCFFVSRDREEGCGVLLLGDL